MPAYIACGQLHPPPDAAHACALAHDEPHGVPGAEPPLTDIPPITDMIFSVAFEPQVGQGIFLSRSPVMSSS